MDLRELLLQFAGENEASLKLDELISLNVLNVSVCRDFNNGIELLVNNPLIAESIVKKIDKLLIKNNYESYDIIIKEPDIIRIELT